MQHLNLLDPIAFFFFLSRFYSVARTRFFTANDGCCSISPRDSREFRRSFVKAGRLALVTRSATLLPLPLPLHFPTGMAPSVEKPSKPPSSSASSAVSQRHRHTTSRTKTQSATWKTPAAATEPQPSLPAQHHRHHRRRCVRYHEVPLFLRDNEYLLKGYRTSATFWDCVDSLFFRHNETFNIWSHLIGAAIYLYLVLHINVFHEWAHDALEHRVVFSLFLGSAAMCCIFSTTYHTFGCMNQRVFRVLLKLDYIGISLLIGSSICIVCYYCYYCEPFWQRIYVSLTLFLLAFGSIVSSLDQFYRAEHRVMRATVFFLMGASGIIPIVHLHSTVGIGHFWKEGIAAWFLLMMVSYSIGTVVFAARIPERWSPGYFDRCFHSHTYMHICVLIAAAFHLVGAVRLYHHLHDRDGFTCSSRSPF